MVSYFSGSPAFSVIIIIIIIEYSLICNVSHIYGFLFQLHAAWIIPFFCYQIFDFALNTLVAVSIVVYPNTIQDYLQQLVRSLQTVSVKYTQTHFTSRRCWKCRNVTGNVNFQFYFSLIKSILSYPYSH